MKSLNTIDDCRNNHQFRPRNLEALAAALEPVIGPWPATDGELESALYRASEEASLSDIEVGRQPDVYPIVRKGKVQVLDAPDYIQVALVHALPDPTLSEHLGSVAVIRSVPVDAHPPPGHCWYVVVKVTGGKRLCLWDHTEWPSADGITAADWEAFVARWNTGVDAGWGTFSWLNDATDSMYFDDDTPSSVLERLKPTAGLTAWLKKQPRFAAL